MYLVLTSRGWVSETSQYTTELKDALRYTKVEYAINAAKRLHNDLSFAVPVNEDHIEYMK